MNFNKMVLELFLNEKTSQRAFAKKIRNKLLTFESYFK